MLRIWTFSVLESSMKLFIPAVKYGSETMLSKEKERSRIRVMQMDNLMRFARY